MDFTFNEEERQFAESVGAIRFSACCLISRNGTMATPFRQMSTDAGVVTMRKPPHLSTGSRRRPDTDRRFIQNREENQFASGD